MMAMQLREPVFHDQLLLNESGISLLNIARVRERPVQKAIVPFEEATCNVSVH
jgi:hypothetical protein